MPLLKNVFLEKIETWHVGLSCQYTHFMSFSSKSEHDTVADQATLSVNAITTLPHTLMPLKGHKGVHLDPLFCFLRLLLNG